MFPLMLDGAWQERPVRGDALLGSSDKVSSLAALADSADYVADVISRSGAMDVSGASGGGDRLRPASPRKNAAANGKSGAASSSSMLTVGMAHLMDRLAAL